MLASVPAILHPKFYKIVILDQRGSGNSVPNAADDLDASLVENNTPALVGDIERLREHLSIDRWGLVLGGSWGSTLALAYAQAHADRCEALLLRGVFLFGPDEVDYLFCSGGTYGQNPEAWSNYKRFIRETSDDWSREETNLLGAYWHRLTGGDKAMREAAAAAFVGYELSISKTYIDPAVISEYLGTPSILIPFAVMEVHYMLNAGFLRRGQLLDGLDVLGKSGMKVRICHGRADYVCQPQAAYRLSEALKAEGVDVGLEFVSGAGHSDSSRASWTQWSERVTNSSQCSSCAAVTSGASPWAAHRRPPCKDPPSSAQRRSISCGAGVECNAWRVAVVSATARLRPMLRPMRAVEPLRLSSRRRRRRSPSRWASVTGRRSCSPAPTRTRARAERCGTCSKGAGGSRAEA